MKRSLFALAAAMLPVAVCADGPKEFKTFLSGFQEVPALSTSGRGGFRARIGNDSTTIQYQLRYDGLEGSVTQAHIHLGQRGVNGGVAVWLCSNLPSPPTPAGVQACPDPPAMIEGVVTAADVVGPSGQGLSAGEFEELLTAIRVGRTYANVHSTLFPGGEVRGQLHPGRGPDDDDD